MENTLYNVIDPVKGQITICGKEYNSQGDKFIYLTLEIAFRCKKELSFFTYEKIMILRCWVRENYQHDLQVNYNGIRTVNGLRKFLRKCVEQEYRVLNDPIEDEWKADLLKSKAEALKHIEQF